jgi:hypothetical protein
MQLRHHQPGELLYAPPLARAAGLVAPFAAVRASRPRFIRRKGVG